MNVIGAIITSKGANILYFPPICIPDSNVPRPSILTRELTSKVAGLDDIKLLIVDSPVFGETVELSL